MTKFPNYRTVVIAEGVTAKVAPMRINTKESQAAFAAIGEWMEGNVGGLVKRTDAVADALMISLRENHTKEEASAILSRLTFSTTPDTPYVNCMLALMGYDPKDPGDDE